MLDSEPTHLLNNKRNNEDQQASRNYQTTPCDNVVDVKKVNKSVLHVPTTTRTKPEVLKKIEQLVVMWFKKFGFFAQKMKLTTEK